MPKLNSSGARRVLVTGAAGFLGQATIRGLLAMPSIERVIGLDLREFPANGYSHRVISVTRDARSGMADLFHEHGVNTVVHLAFLLRTDRNQGNALSVNVGATEALIRSFDESLVRGWGGGEAPQIIYLSSSTTYGAHEGFSSPYTEDVPSRPVRGFQYSEHKVLAEGALLEYAKMREEVSVCILRGCVIMAAGADNFIARALGRRLLPAPAGANPAMQFLHLSDYVSAVQCTVTANARGIYNIAGDGTVRWRDMAKIAGARLVPVPAGALRFIVDSTWKLRLQNESPAPGIELIRYPWLASTAKIKNELGWKPEFTSMEALQEWAGARR